MNYTELYLDRRKESAKQQEEGRYCVFVRVVTQSQVS